MSERVLEAISRSLNREDVTLTVLGDGSGVILDMAGHHVLSVNPVGMCVINTLKEGVCTVADLVEAVCASFDVSAEQAGEDVRVFIEQASQWLVR